MASFHRATFPATKERVGNYAPSIDLDCNFGLMAQASVFMGLAVEHITEKSVKKVAKEQSLMEDKIRERIAIFLEELPSENKKETFRYGHAKQSTYLNLWEIHGIPAFAGLFSTLSILTDNNRQIFPISPASRYLKIPLQIAKKYIDADELLDDSRKKIKMMNPLMVRLSYSEKTDTAELYFFHALHEKDDKGLAIKIDYSSISSENPVRNSLGIKDKTFDGLMPEILDHLIAHTLYAIGGCTNLLMNKVDLTEEYKAGLPDADLSGNRGYPYLRRPENPKKVN